MRRREGIVTKIGDNVGHGELRTHNPEVKDVPLWSTSSVSSWLISQSMDSYVDTFFDHQIDGYCLLHITEDNLINTLKVSKLGHVKHLLKAIEELRHVCLLPLSLATSEVNGGVLVNSTQQSGIDLPEKLANNTNVLRSSPKYFHTYSNSTGPETDSITTLGSSNRSQGRKKYKSSQFWKVILSCAYAFGVQMLTAAALVIGHNRVPDMEKYPPLPDIVLDNLPHIPWAFAAAEICIVILVIIFWVVFAVHQYRFIILKRACCLSGTIFLLRICTMPMTSVSVPNAQFTHCNRKIEMDFWSVTKSMLVIFTGLGMSVTGVRTCGDYIYSGHTCILTLLNLCINEYTPRTYSLVHTSGWILNCFGIFFILAAHEHYSLDVFIAFYITSRLFLYYHSLANSRILDQEAAADEDRLHLRHQGTYQEEEEADGQSSRTRIWFPLFTFFESDSPQRIPNIYESPLKFITDSANTISIALRTAVHHITNFNFR